MRPRRRIAALAALLPLLAASGCGYHLSGRGGASALPASVRSLVVLPFDNRTNRPEIEQRVTEEVTRLMSRRGRYKIVSDPQAADAALAGAVTSYQTTAVQFSANGRATRIEAVVQIAATLRETASDEILWSQAGLVFRQQFDVPETSVGVVGVGPTGGPSGFFDEETLALDSIARGVAETLVNSIFEGF